ILRTAWLYGWHGSNFVKTMLRLAGSRERIEVVDDQRGNPTYAPDLARAIVVIAERVVAAPGEARLRGTFHLVGPDSATGCDFAREIMSFPQALGGPVAEIAAIASRDYAAAAVRPRDSRLDCGRMRAAFAIELPRRAVSLEKCIRELLKA